MCNVWERFKVLVWGCCEDFFIVYYRDEFNNIIFFVRGIGCLYSRFLYGGYLFFIYIFNDFINIYYLVMFGNCGFS